jgi:hypothetical protein
MALYYRPDYCSLSLVIAMSILGCNRDKSEHSLGIGLPKPYQSVQTRQTPKPDRAPKLSDLLETPAWHSADDDQKKRMLSRAVADRLNGHQANVTSVDTLLIIGSPEFDEYAAHRIINDLHDMAKLAGYVEIDVERIQPRGTICRDNLGRIYSTCPPIFTWTNHINEPTIPSLR